MSWADELDHRGTRVVVTGAASGMITGQILGVDGGIAGAINGGGLPTPELRDR